MADKVAVIGAGSWGTAVAGLVARHANEVVLWAHSQAVTDGINTSHANPRYLVDYRLPENVRSTTSLARAADGAEAVNEHGIDAFFPILRGISTLDEALNKENAYKNLKSTATQVFRLIK